MSDLLFVKRQGNGELQYSVPQGYDWASSDSHRRPCPNSLTSKPPARRTSPARHKLPPLKQDEKAQKRWSLGPWQHVKLRPASTPCDRSPLLKPKRHSGAPVCSIVMNCKPCPVKLETKPPEFTPPWVVHKKEELTSRHKAIMKARSATVLPVVALSQNGEWVPPSSGRKAHARLTSHRNGGWSNASLSTLAHGARATTETGGFPYTEDQKREAEVFSLNRPLLNSSAFLLHKLRIAEEELNNAHVSMHRASALLGCDWERPNRKDCHFVRGSKGASGKSPQAMEVRCHTAAKHADPNPFSVRSSCIGRQNKKKT